jgi:hypothetical protein
MKSCHHPHKLYVCAQNLSQLVAALIALFLATLTYNNCNLSDSSYEVAHNHPMIRRIGHLYLLLLFSGWGIFLTSQVAFPYFEPKASIIADLFIILFS